jgi:Pyruvate/2-oxoacid:ferredoxin oxidoreductase delta subunit
MLTLLEMLVGYAGYFCRLCWLYCVDVLAKRAGYID